jgi:hypothetical protein
MNTRALSFRAALVAMSAVLLSGPVDAQERRMLDERGSVLFGMFVTEPDTNARFDAASGSGTDVDLEDDLGFDSSKTVGRLSGYYWLNTRHRLDFSLFNYSRDAEKRIERTIDFGDETFEIDTVVTASADVSVFKAAYTFAPVVRERGDFGITAGLYTAKLDFTLASRQSASEETGDLTAPLPVFGVRGRFAISERVSLGGAVELFAIDTGEFGGRLSDSYLGVDYTFNDRVGVGVAYNLVSMAVDADESGDGFRGELDWGYDGYMLYVKFDFGR